MQALIFWSFFIFKSWSLGLEMRGLEMPRLAELHRSARLGCRFRLGPNRLYTVKWYKDGEEFYRFTPGEKPRYRTFPVAGAQVQVESSDLHIVTLKNVSRVSAGVYTCEVSSDGPDFATVKAEAIMDVYSLPDRYPEIIMEKTYVYPGERLNASCISGMSYPKQTLTWFLNGVQVNSSCVSWEMTTGTGMGLLRSYSNVSVLATGGPGHILLSCVAVQDPLLPTVRGLVEVTLKGAPSHQRFMDSSTGSSTIEIHRSQIQFVLQVIALLCIYSWFYLTFIPQD